jgi:hypothetical protein
MPTFEIPDGPTTVDLQGTGDEKNPGPATGSVVFNVTNKSAESADGSLSVQVAGSTKKEWFTIEGDQVRSFGPGETQTAKINVSLGKEVPPGDYPFRLRAAAVNDPDNDAAEGPVSVAKKKEAAVAPKKSLWWLWLIIALVVLAAIGAAVYFLFLNKPSGTAVPDFVNKTVDQAKAAPQGFTITEVAGPATGKAPGTIVSQEPAAGESQPSGTAIRVTFDPGVAVPRVIGQNIGTAVNTLQAAALHIQNSTTKCEDSGNADEILDQDPKPDAKAPKDSGVNVTVRTVGGMFGTTRLKCGQKIPPFIFLRTVRATPEFQTMAASRKAAVIAGLQEPEKK